MKCIRSFIVLLLFALSGYSIAVLYLHFIESKSTVPPQVVTIKQIPKSREKLKSVDEYLKGVKALFPPPAEAKAIEGSDGGSANTTDSLSTPSSLKLVATIIGDHRSLAVINDTKKDRVVAQWQSIDGYKVKQIISNNVVLTDGTHDIVLRLGCNVSVTPLEGTAEPAPYIPKEIAPGVFQIELARWEFERMTDPPRRESCGEWQMITVARHGRPYGLQIALNVKGSLLENLGFLSGDVILSVNNKSIQTPEEGFTAYQMMKSEEVVDFKIDRQGRICHLKIVFR
ncbi:MAG: hypothetical protein AB2L14_37565 [Candidatus Xenobiia bacterium LiM19]